MGIAGAIAGSAAIGAVGSVASGVIGAGAAKSAASQQAAAQLQAAQIAQQQNEVTRADLAPFRATGAAVLPAMADIAWQPGGTAGAPNYLTMAAGLAPGRMTEAELMATPGYQFTRDQGLQAVQNSAAARGLGVSGAAMKGAATFATGLADKTYQDQFNIAQQRFQNALALNTTQQGNITNQFNRLASVGQLGENAAAQTGTIGANLAGVQGADVAGAGAARAAGTVGAGNAIGGAFTGVANAATGAVNNYLGYNLATQLANKGQTGGFVDDTSTFV